MAQDRTRDRQDASVPRGTLNGATLARIQHRRRNGFTQISNQLAQDSRLSHKARGLFLELWSRPVDWVTSADRLARQGPEGRDSIRSGLRELEESGYLVRERKNGDDGQISWVWMLDDQPEPAGQTIDGKPVDGEPIRETAGQTIDGKPVDGKPVDGKPGPGLPPPYKDRGTKTDQLTTDQETNPAADATAWPDLDVGGEPTVTPDSVVAAFVDGRKGSGMSPAAPSSIKKIAGRAKRMLTDGCDGPRLLAAAFAMGTSGWTNLDTAYDRQEAAGSPTPTSTLMSGHEALINEFRIIDHQELPT